MAGYTDYSDDHFTAQPQGIVIIIIISIQPLGRFWQEPEPSQVTGMALARCILGKFLGVVCHCFPLEQRFSNFFSRGGHCYQSQCSTDRPTLVRFERRVFEILNYSVMCSSRSFYFFCLFRTNVQSKRTTRAEPEDHLWSADHSLRNAALGDCTACEY
jgi:hypothetical protein